MRPLRRASRIFVIAACRLGHAECPGPHTIAELHKRGMIERRSGRGPVSEHKADVNRTGCVALGKSHAHAPRAEARASAADARADDRSRDRARCAQQLAKPDVIHASKAKPHHIAYSTKQRLSLSPEFEATQARTLRR